MRERSATRNFAENLDADTDNNDSAHDRQHDRQDRLNRTQSIICNRGKGARQSRNDSGFSLINYPLPFMIFVAMATAARIPYIAEQTRNPAEKPSRNICGKSASINSISAAISSIAPLQH